MTETFCNSGSVKLKAGANVSTALTAAQYTEMINQAESYLNSVMEKNYTDTFSGLNADVSKILEDAASSHAAMVAINYDMNGYKNNAQAQTMLDFNYTRLTDCIIQLKEKDKQAFIDGA